MKKYFAFIFVLLCPVLMLVGCKKYNSVTDNVSEITTIYYRGFDEASQAVGSISVGQRETPYKIDGKHNKMTDFSLIDVNFNNDMNVDEIQASIFINGVEESLTMYFNPMNHHYMADLGYSLSNGDQISLQYQGFNIAFADITSTFAVDSSQAISIAVGHLENDLKSFYQNNQFKGECYLKILTMQDDESGNLFWYFSAVSQDGDKLDIVISTADGSVIIG